MSYPDSARWEPPADASNDDVDLALTLAWSTIQALSGYRIATAPITLRPCARRCAPGSYIVAPVSGPAGTPWWPFMLASGDIINVLTCECRADCSCTAYTPVALPGPVGAIDSVVINGEYLTPEAYRVDDGNRLVRQDGDVWPRCQDYTKPDGQADTFSVTYWRGIMPDSQINWIAGILASEWLSAIRGDKKCRLPKGTTQVVRAGTSYTVETNWFDNGRTGIEEVDNVMSLYNPGRLRFGGPAILDIDGARGHVTTLGG